MLKQKIIRHINYSDEEDHCTWQQVLDEAATAAAIAQCENMWQGRVDTCDEQIQQYNEFKDKINEKLNEAQALNKEFQSNSHYMAEANITHEAARDSMNECDDCIHKLENSYNDMISSCEQSISDWESKKSEAESMRDQCASAPENKRYKWVCI